MREILALPLSFKIRLLVRIYIRRYSNLMLEIKLRQTLKTSFTIEGLEKQEQA